MRVTSKAGTSSRSTWSAPPRLGLGLDRQAWHAGALARRHRRQLSQERYCHGTLVMAAGDINLTSSANLTSPIRMTLKDDYVTDLEGGAPDAMMMRAYSRRGGDREAYAVSHVGFGMNPAHATRRWQCTDQRDTNGTELRAGAGNFLFSTGAQRICRAL